MQTARAVPLHGRGDRSVAPLAARSPRLRSADRARARGASGRRPPRRSRQLLGLGAALALFAALATLASASRRPPAEVALLRVVHAHEPGGLAGPLGLLNLFGGAAVLVPLLLSLAGVQLLRQGWREALFLLLVTAGLALSPLLKTLVERPRPLLWPPPVRVEGSSFPSGHALVSAAFALALWRLTGRTRWRWAVARTGLLFVVAVGFSRVTLGVHYPSDVAAGWALAVIVVEAAAWASGANRICGPGGTGVGARGG